MKNDFSSGVRSSRIVVTHAPLKGVDDVTEFLKNLAEALNERAGCSNVTEGEIAQGLSKTLVHYIALEAREVITQEAVLKIHGIGADAAESKRVVENHLRSICELPPQSARCDVGGPPSRSRKDPNFRFARSTNI